MKIKKEETPELIQNFVCGEVDTDTIIQYWEQEVGFYGKKPVLWNFECCSLADVDLENWRKIIPRTAELSSIRKDCRAALLGTKMNIGLLQIIEVIARNSHHPVEVKAFTNLEEAKRWLFEHEK